jgi:hypothetical protein
MPLDIAAGASAPAPSPIQFVNIETTPLMGGEYSVVMQATLLDEEELEFIGQDLANERVETLDQAIQPRPSCDFDFDQYPTAGSDYVPRAPRRRLER